MGLRHLEEGGEGTSGGDEGDRGDVGTSTRRGGGRSGTGRGLGGSRAGRVGRGGGLVRGLAGGASRGRGRSRDTSVGGTGVGRAGGRGGRAADGRGAGRGTASRGTRVGLGGAVRATVGDRDSGRVLDSTRAVLDLDGDGLTSRNLSNLPGKRSGLGSGPGLESLAVGVAALNDRDVVRGLATGPGEESGLALGKESVANSL